MKRGAIEIDMLGKILLALIFLLIVAFLIFAGKDKLLLVVDKLKDLLRFGN